MGSENFHTDNEEDTVLQSDRKYLGTEHRYGYGLLRYQLKPAQQEIALFAKIYI